MKSILLIKKLSRLVEMMSGLVKSASFSLPEWQAVKMIFFAPCKKFCRDLLQTVKRYISFILEFISMKYNNG